jgi:hypothetical protein
MRGRRRRLKRANEAKTTEGSSVCPVNEYVTKARTEARAEERQVKFGESNTTLPGMDMATALVPDLNKSKERMYLDSNCVNIEVSAGGRIIAYAISFCRYPLIRARNGAPQLNS